MSNSDGKKQRKKQEKIKKPEIISEDEIKKNKIKGSI